MAYSDERISSILTTSPPIRFSLSGWENARFEPGSDRVNMPRIRLVLSQSVQGQGVPFIREVQSERGRSGVRVPGDLPRHLPSRVRL